MLARYACHPEKSRGRLHPEPECSSRSPFQRDRDRVIHSTAFRRLEYKTQVFVNHEGDHYRNRLTHSLEVSQIARSLARALHLNEDLAEALALAHDLGHTPFGHAGEEALSGAMAQFGGFDHNAHTIRIVTQLEHRYAEFDGLNLTWETLEGIAKHNGPLVGIRDWALGIGENAAFDNPECPAPNALLPRALAEYTTHHDLELHSYASLEAQVASLSDDIAYSNHDIDDGLRAQAFTVEDLQAVPHVYAVFDEVRTRYPGIEMNRLIHESIRRLINRMCTDLLIATHALIAQSGVKSVEDVRAYGAALVGFLPAQQETNLQLKTFLMERMYRHSTVNRMSSKARRVVKALFEFFITEPECLPMHWRALTNGPGTVHTAHVVSDFIAGMTDRFAFEEYKRIFEVGGR